MQGFYLCNEEDVFFSGLWDKIGGPETCARNAKLIISLLQSSFPAQALEIFTQCSERIFWDIGCATGEGTAVWNAFVKTLDHNNVAVGVDPFETTMFLAKKRHPKMEFRTVVPFGITRSTDILIFSNMLQGIDDPEGFIIRHAQRLTQYMIFLVPYNDQRFPHQFNKDIFVDRLKIPYMPNSYLLMGSRYIPPSEHWDGTQALHVYRREDS